MSLFAGFDQARVDVAGGVRLRVRTGGGPVDSGHHMAEEAPEELAAALIPFLRM